MSQVTYTLRRPYRETEEGAVSKTVVFRVGSNGEVSMVKPSLVEKSRTGRHGYVTWSLGNGRYVVVYVERPNNTQKPYSIEFYCLEVVNGKAVRNVRVSATYVSRVTEWEIMSEVSHVAFYCVGNLPW
jgi:hypothetical protein